VLREGRRLGQLEQGQVIAVRLGHAEVEAGVDDLLQHAVLLHGQRLVDVAQILGVQLPQVDGDVRQLGLLDAVGGGGHHVGRDEHPAALVLRDADVRLPRVLGELGRSTADDALLQSVLRRSG